MANKTPATIESSLETAETVCPEQEVGARDTAHPAYGNSSLYHFSVQEILERELDHLNSWNYLGWNYLINYLERVITES